MMRRVSIWFCTLILLAACATPPYGPAPKAPAPTPPETSGRGVEVQPAVPPEAPAPVEPLPPTTPSREYRLSAASKAMVDRAQSQIKGGNFALAASSIERALSIEPNNPLLWIEYGKVRMAENNYAQAGSMAQKALATATGDPKAQATAWRLLAESYRARNRNNEAREAEAHADSLVRR